MKYEPVRSKKNSDTYCEGKCSIFNESATLSIYLSGKQICESDLQPTFKPHIKECSLLEGKNEKSRACMLTCKVFEEYKNSHDY